MYPDANILGVAYADKLKQVHMEHVGCDDLEVYNNHLHDGVLFNGINLRDDIADLSERILKDNPTYNVDNVRRTISEHPDTDLAMITDMRYPVEYAYSTINQHDLVRITRIEPSEEVMNQRWNKHISTFFPDHTIDNVHDIHKLYEDIIKMLDMLDIKLPGKLMSYGDIEETILKSM